MPTLCPFLTVPWVGLQSVIVAFLDRSYSIIFETIIIVDDNTIVFYKIEL